MTATSADTHVSDHNVTRDAIQPLRELLNGVIRGKKEVIELVLTCLLARGHLLLEDLPGLGKTTLAKTLAAAVGGVFTRVQCTPDLMPTDVTGFHLFNQKTREFEFHEGPVFADVLLADEINRATPRTQSALFEAMAERQVTVDKTSHLLPPTFFVIATQNPVDSQGVYPLPEAQLDRFAMKLSLGYPDRQSELEILANDVGGNQERSACDSIFTPSVLCDLQDAVAAVSVCDKVQRYLVDLAEATRQRDDIALGLSPRGLLIWQRVAQARAYLANRPYVTPDDVQDVAKPVLSVRMTGDFSSANSVIESILSEVATPMWD